MTGYDFSLDREAVVAFAACRAGEQQFLLHAFEEVARHPFVEGDCVLRDERGRNNQVMDLGSFVISFWADHALRIVRITVIERL